MSEGTTVWSAQEDVAELKRKIVSLEAELDLYKDLVEMQKKALGLATNALNEVLEKLKK